MILGTGNLFIKMSLAFMKSVQLPFFFFFFNFQITNDLLKFIMRYEINERVLKVSHSLIISKTGLKSRTQEHKL